jgi:O-acetyl-ADP-ribose deacetylase (regulator of RNase III)
MMDKWRQREQENSSANTSFMQVEYSERGEIMHTKTEKRTHHIHLSHSVGPVWHGGNRNEENKLGKAIRESLQCAEKLECKSIAIPAISSGIFGFPLDRYEFDS